MTPLIREPRTPLDYLTLDELEALAWDLRDQVVSIIAAEGPTGPIWLLRFRDERGVEQTRRAHRPHAEAGAVGA